jgi:DNA-binding MarR family transcriptional regulator
VNEDSANNSRFFDLSSGVAIRMRRVIESGLRERGLTFAQFGALKALSIHNGISQAELASALDTDSTTAMVLRTSLEKKGLVSRTSDPGDGRIKRIGITDSGRSILRASEPGVNAFFAKTQGIASEADVKKAIQTLEKFYLFAGEAVEAAASAKVAPVKDSKRNPRAAVSAKEAASIRGAKKRGAGKTAKKADEKKAPARRVEAAKARAAKKAPAKAVAKKARKN